MEMIVQQIGIHYHLRPSSRSENVTVEKTVLGQGGPHFSLVFSKFYDVKSCVMSRDPVPSCSQVVKWVTFLTDSFRL